MQANDKMSNALNKYAITHAATNQKMNSYTTWHKLTLYFQIKEFIIYKKKIQNVPRHAVIYAIKWISEYHDIAKYIPKLKSLHNTIWVGAMYNMKRCLPRDELKYTTDMSSCVSRHALVVLIHELMCSTTQFIVFYDMS